MKVLVLILISIFFSFTCVSQKSEYEKQLFSTLSSQKTKVDFINSIDKFEINNSNSALVFIGGGVGIADFDNDGLQDIFFSSTEGNDKLYRNKGKLRFEDVTEKAFDSISNTWHTGISIVDVNNDGFLDIYISVNWKIENEEIVTGHNLLYINNQDLTFTESAEEYGLADAGPSIQSAFFDVDQDGDLDVYVMNNPTTVSNFKDMKVPPVVSMNDHFYINENGKYLDKSKEFGIGGYSAGLGIWVDDVNADGYPDIYVANDFNVRDYLFINQEGKSFKEKIKEKTHHISQFGMGTDFGDINNDGYQDIFTLDMSLEDRYQSKTNMRSMDSKTFKQIVARGHHYQYMHNTLQLNNQHGQYSEVSFLTKTSKSDWSWSALFSDFDLDGYSDIAITNGPYKDINNRDLIIKIQDSLGPNWDQDVVFKLADKISAKNKFFQNTGHLKFKDVSDKWGFEIPDNSNGMAYADLDNDGDLDLVINRLNAEALIMENNSTKKDFIAFDIKGLDKNLFAYGASVKIRQGEHILTRKVSPVRGMMSSVDRRLHFGLLPNQEIDQIIITFPNGKETPLSDYKKNTINKVDLKNLKITPFRNIQIFPLFNEVETTGIQHKENDFDDYEREILLPYGYSNLGPGLASLSKDEKVILTGAKGQKSKIIAFNSNGLDLESIREINDLDQEIVNAIELDNNFILLISGGNEGSENDSIYRDLILDDKGNLSFFDKNNTASSKVAITADFDSDGDKDLFIGGRITPGQFPKQPASYIYRNTNGEYIDVTDEVCPELRNLGMITSAHFEDYNLDGKIDLLVMGEYMPLTLFINDGSKLVKQNTDLKTEGIWMTSTSVDIDNDGDLDIIAGNLGLNNKFKASYEKPFNIYGNDFDKNGTMDIVLSAFYDSIEYPIRGKECSTQQMPFISEKFETYDGFAKATLSDIYEDDLEKSIHLTARTFESSVFVNDGHGNFSMQPLPVEAQLSVVTTIQYLDVNKDGLEDILLFGNWYNVEIETTRFDASYGQLLINNGDLTFSPIAPKNSGIHIDGNVQNSTKIELDGITYVLLGLNDDKMKILKLN